MTSFSVIIPTRGRHHFLRQAIGSVLEQQHAAHEIIVVDDGEGAAEAVGRMHASVRVLDNRQRGPVPARDLGVSEATGDCIAFLDDDDWWTDAGYLKTAATRFDAGATFTYANGIMAFEDGRDHLPFDFEADAQTLMHDNTILISAVIYRRDLHAALGRFDESLPFYWDWDWYLRVGACRPQAGAYCIARCRHTRPHPEHVRRIAGSAKAHESRPLRRQARLAADPAEESSRHRHLCAGNAAAPMSASS
jgi:glycosyltransferase involved in cell wall biosynthesis